MKRTFRRSVFGVLAALSLMTATATTAFALPVKTNPHPTCGHDVVKTYIPEKNGR